MYWLLPEEKQDIIRKKIEDVTEKILNTNSEPESVYRNAYIYSSRKSTKLIEIILKYFSKENDIVYDPFMGSGSVIFESLLSNRRIIGNDLDNYSYFIVKNILQKCNLSKLESYFNFLSNNCKPDIYKLYTTKCCNYINFIDKLFYDRSPLNYFSPMKNTGFNDNKNIKFVYKCKVCGKAEKIFDKSDLILINIINRRKNNFPNDKFIINSRINITPNHSEYYKDHFTKRAQEALIILQKNISNLPNSSEKDILQLILVTSLHLCKITDYKSKSQDLYHLVNINALEHNVWNVFENRFKSIKRLKFNKLKSVQINFSSFFKKELKLLLLNKSALLLDNDRINNSVDIIITDPPYTDSVPFLERNQIFRIWLDKFHGLDWKFSDYMKKNEMIISDSPERCDKSGWEQYAKNIDSMFRNFSKTLKKDGFCIIFLRPGRKYWIDVVNQLKLSARKYGIEPLSRIDVSKKDPSMRKLWSASWANYTDSIMIFYKSKKEYTYWFEGDYWIEKEIVKYLKIKIEEKEEHKIYYGSALKLAHEFLERIKLSRACNKSELIAQCIKRYFNFKDGWIYLNEFSFKFDDYTSKKVINRIIDLTPELIEALLDEKRCFTFEDLMMKLSVYLDNGDKDIIEELRKKRSVIIDILKEYTDQTSNGFISKKIIPKVKKPNSIFIHDLSGNEFETLITNVLKKKGYSKVFKVGGSGDRGVDIIARINTKKSRNKAIIQCKRCLINVGSVAIQRLHSYKIMEKQDLAICITTSDFTSEAIDIAKRVNIELINGDKIYNWIEEVFPGEYYL